MSKENLLALLEEHKGEILSGNHLSERLGISRNAVWKSVNALRKEGHFITSIRNRGYLLELSSDHLSESGIRRHLSGLAPDYEMHLFDRLPSTNSYLKEHKDLKNNTLVLAKTQTEGRGRMGKTFHSLDQGGIYLSVLKTTDLADYDTRLSTLAAALAVSETLDRYMETETSIKWVNDVYHEGLKLSGILTEGTLEFESGTLSSLIIGIGINVNTESFPEELEGIATSLYRVTGRKTHRNELIARLLESLEVHLLLTKENPEELLEKYRHKMLYLGEDILIHQNNEILTGRLLTLNEQGHLIIDSENGPMTLHSGEISIRKKERT